MDMYTKHLVLYFACMMHEILGIQTVIFICFDALIIGYAILPFIKFHKFTSFA